MYGGNNYKLQTFKMLSEKLIERERPTGKINSLLSSRHYRRTHSNSYTKESAVELCFEYAQHGESMICRFSMGFPPYNLDSNATIFHFKNFIIAAWK